jgi:hypothetical protein
MASSFERRLEEARRFALEHPRLPGDAVVNAVVWWEEGRSGDWEGRSGEWTGWTIEIFRDHKLTLSAPLESLVQLSDPKDPALSIDEVRDATSRAVERLTGHVPHLIIVPGDEHAGG